MEMQDSRPGCPFGFFVSFVFFVDKHLFHEEGRLDKGQVIILVWRQGQSKTCGGKLRSNSRRTEHDPGQGRYGFGNSAAACGGAGL
jgi:hypothetical protein